MIKTYFNATNGPVSLGDNKTIGSQEWATLESTDPSVKDAFKKGYLVVVEEPEKIQAKSPAKDAFKEAEEMKEEAAANKDDKK